MVNPLKTIIKNRPKKSKLDIMKDSLYNYLFVKSNAYELFGYDDYVQLLDITIHRKYSNMLPIDIIKLANELLDRYTGVGINITINNSEEELKIKEMIFNSLKKYMFLVGNCSYGELIEVVKQKCNNENMSCTLEPAVLTSETISKLLERNIITKSDNEIYVYRNY